MTSRPTAPDVVVGPWKTQVYVAPFIGSVPTDPTSKASAELFVTPSGPASTGAPASSRTVRRVPAGTSPTDWTMPEGQYTVTRWAADEAPSPMKRPGSFEEAYSPPGCRTARKGFP